MTNPLKIYNSFERSRWIESICSVCTDLRDLYSSPASLKVKYWASVRRLFQAFDPYFSLFHTKVHEQSTIFRCLTVTWNKIKLDFVLTFDYRLHLQRNYLFASQKKCFPCERGTNYWVQCSMIGAPCACLSNFGQFEVACWRNFVKNNKWVRAMRADRRSKATTAAGGAEGE